MGQATERSTNHATASRLLVALQFQHTNRDNLGITGPGKGAIGLGFALNL